MMVTLKFIVTFKRKKKKKGMSVCSCRIVSETCVNGFVDALQHQMYRSYKQTTTDLFFNNKKAGNHRRITDVEEE